MMLKGKQIRVKNMVEEEMDACKNCIRCQKFEVHICPKCGQKAVKTELDGPCMRIKCTSCDYDVIGASFYALCEQDRERYILKVLNQNLSNQQIVGLRKLLHARALEIKRALKEEVYISRQLYLTQLLDVIQSIEAMGIAYSVEPELKYSRIFSCEKRMKIYEME